MRISGKVIDAITKESLPNAKVIIVIDDNERATLYTDSSGIFEHSEERNYTGKELCCQTAKNGYKMGSPVYKIEDEEIELEVELVPENKIALVLKVIDKEGSPLEGVKFFIGIESEEIDTGESDKKGQLTIQLETEFEGKELWIKAERKGYDTAESEIKITKDNIHQISMKKIIVPQSNKKRFKTISAIGVIFIIIISILIFYPKNNAPVITFNEPQDGDVFSTNKIMLSVFVDDKNGIKSVAVNGNNATYESSNKRVRIANFTLPKPGENKIEVKAIDSSGKGKENTKTIKVYYIPSNMLTGSITAELTKNKKNIKKNDLIKFLEKEESKSNTDRRQIDSMKRLLIKKN